MSDKTLQDLMKLDLSDYATAPYKLTSDTVPETKNVLLSEKLRGSTIGDQWKTPAIDTLTGLKDRIPTAAEDFAWSIGTNTVDAIHKIIPTVAIEAITNPAAFAVGAGAAKVGITAGAQLGSAVTGKFWRTALKGLGGIAGGLGTAAVAAEALEVKSTASAEYDSPLDPRYQQRMIKELEAKYANNEISDEEYQKTKEEYLKFVRGTEQILKQAAVNKNEKNEVVDLLEGREYPDGSMVDNVLSWASNKIADRAELRAWQMEKRNMNPNGIANTAGSIIGNLVPLYASSYMYRSALTAPKYKTIKGVYSATTGAEKVIKAPTTLSRAEVAEKTEKFGKAYTFAQMASQYEADNVLEYIEKTGDKDLLYYNPSTAQGAMAAAYGAVGTMTEYELGGIEPLIAGSFKKLGFKLPTAKAIVKTAGQEAAEEAVQNIEEFLSRNIDDTNNKTWGEFLTDTVKGAVWGAVMGGTIGGYTFHTNRRNLIKGIMAYGNGQINEVQATQLADTIINTAEETTDYKKDARLEKIKTLVAATYEGADIPEAEKADAIDATAALEYAMIMRWNTLNGTNIDDDPIFKGEVNELGYFRTGIPETQRANIESYLTELRDLQKQIKDTTEELKNARTAEKPDTEQIKKLSQKIDELETKVETMKSDEYRLKRIGELEAEDKRNIKAELRRRKAQLQAEQLAQQIKEKAQQDQEKEEKAAAEKANREAIREMNRAKAQQKAEAEERRKILVRHATDESLKNILRGREGWADDMIERMTSKELRDAVLKIKDVDITKLEQKPVSEIELARQKQNAPKTLTAKRYFHRKINKRFAEESGIRDAWGYSENDKAVNVVFVTNGGLADWDAIVQELQTDGYMPSIYGRTYEETSAIEEAAKDIVLNNKELTEKSDNVAAEVEYYATEGYDILLEHGYTKKQLASMSTNDIRKALIEIAPKAEEEDISHIADVDIDWQNKKRGAYIPFYRFILRANKMDASTLSHELAHDWFEQYISHAKSGKATKEFMTSWNALAKALDLDPDNQASIRQASETFARAYEGWIMNKQEWAKDTSLSDQEKDAVEKMFQRYQQHLKEIYDNLTNPYFQKTWGKVGELKPEISQWFDKVTETTDIDAQLRNGAITEDQAAQMRIESTIDKAIENSDMSTEDKKAIRNAQLLNDTKRYEVEGGNKNAIQNRLSELARNIDENNMIVNKQYDTHRDMLAVAEAADNFVRTRTDEALDIINGLAPETEGLFATDLYTALERLANETNDLALVEQLSESEIATKLAKELGQRVAGFRNFLADGRIDTVNFINTLSKKFDNALTQKGKSELTEAEKIFAEEVKAQDERANKEIDNILKEMECK